MIFCESCDNMFDIRELTDGICEFCEESFSNVKTQIDILAEKLKETGLKVNKYKDRIYIKKFGKDITAYILLHKPKNLDFDDLLENTTLKVYSTANQNRYWLLNRAKQKKHKLMRFLYRKKISNVKPCENWQEVILF